MRVVKTITVAKKENNLELKFKYTINVSLEGIFSTTLPSEIATLFLSYGISLNENKLKNPGYFYSETMEDLIIQVNKVIELFFSRKVIKNEIVIRFQIRTTCSYCKANGATSDVVPNGRWVKDNKYEWFNGNVNQDAVHRYPYGILVYVKPFHKTIYEYNDKSTKAEYVFVSSNENFDNRYYLKYLNDFVSIEPIEHIEMHEVDYSEESAEFFVNLLVSICMLNDKIKDYLNPDGIKLMIENKVRLLSK